VDLQFELRELRRVERFLPDGPELSVAVLKPLAFGSLLLLSSALVAPAALAQETPPATPPAPEQRGGQDEIEISAPGADPGPDIVIRGTRSPNSIRRTPQVVSVLSSEDIARTGEGDIAGALQRVTGLSVVGNGFVFVRGLGDRYSLALLNGSPVPSPEPLRRVVPLDIFPTSVIASSLVQKSYSVNYPGEFGGGVINLTTRAIPRESFISIGGSATWDSETTNQIGYSYDGGDYDYVGYDDGTRRFPTGLRSAVAGGTFAATTGAERRDFAASLSNAPTTLLQRMDHVPANFGIDLSAGTATDLGGVRLGVIAAFGYSNAWRSRDAIQQVSVDPALGDVQTSFEAVNTEDRILVNALVGVGAEFGRNAIRWTSLYIHDTLKQGRLARGFNRSVAPPQPGLPDPLILQNTNWFERQLFDTQLVGEFHFGNFSIDLRGSYAKTRRSSPYERAFSYAYLGDNNPATSGTGDVDDYVNNLSSAGQSASVAFSDLHERLWAGAVDLGYRLPTALPINLSAGYYYSRTDRSASRYQFDYFRLDGALPLGVAQERPDFLVSDFNIYSYNIQLRDSSSAEGAAAYDAGLEINAGYGQAEIEPLDGLKVNLGVRYESAGQFVSPVGSTLPPTTLRNDYWLPAATITWTMMRDVQLRLAASRTIARPQFRELAPQLYLDFESDRQFTGNPFLTDSRLTNAEARLEYYFARDQRITIASFYKDLDNPIEQVAFIAGGDQLRTGFANASGARLYGAELEVQAYYPLAWLGRAFATRRLLFVGNYTYTQSRLRVDASPVIGPSLQAVPAAILFADGAPLTGQSDHLANVQIGIEDTDRLSQATILISYASERVTNRGPIASGVRLPDIVERPGLRLDFVAREEVALFGGTLELRLEARNLLGRAYHEFQQAGANRVEVNTYRVGRTFSAGMTLRF
jgi:outer membrane receptor protein involved in Fe transport